MPPLPPRTPTPGQQRILEFLDAYGLLPTHQLHAYVGTPTTLDATWKMLARLRTYGWISSHALDPTRGGGAEYGWQLTPVGAALLGVPTPSAADIQAVQAALPLHPVLSAKQQTLLRLLARWRQLTTSQIWQELHAEKPRHYTKDALGDLRRAGLVRSRPAHPEQGATSEHYWFLREPGAQALDIAHDSHFRRRPTRETLAFRGLQLDLMCQARAGGWTVIPPDRYSRAQPRPAATPQSRHLVAAALEQERQAVAAALARGVPAPHLQLRLDMLRVGSVGALVPPTVNDYVVYRPEAPHCAAVLIPHPPYATESFWTRPPTRGRPSLEPRSQHDSRIERYRRLATVLPVLAIFPTWDLGYHYGEILTRAGLAWVLAADLNARLATLHQLAPP